MKRKRFRENTFPSNVAHLILRRHPRGISRAFSDLERDKCYIHELWATNFLGSSFAGHRWGLCSTSFCYRAIKLSDLFLACLSLLRNYVDLKYTAMLYASTSLRRTVRTYSCVYKHAGTAYNSVRYAKPRYRDAFDEHWRQQLAYIAVPMCIIQDSSIHRRGTEHNLPLQDGARYRN